MVAGFYIYYCHQYQYNSANFNLSQCIRIIVYRISQNQFNKMGIQLLNKWHILKQSSRRHFFHSTRYFQTVSCPFPHTYFPLYCKVCKDSGTSSLCSSVLPVLTMVFGRKGVLFHEWLNLWMNYLCSFKNVLSISNVRLHVALLSFP